MAEDKLFHRKVAKDVRQFLAFGFKGLRVDLLVNEEDNNNCRKEEVQTQEAPVDSRLLVPRPFPPLILLFLAVIRRLIAASSCAAQQPGCRDPPPHPTPHPNMVQLSAKVVPSNIANIIKPKRDDRGRTNGGGSHSENCGDVSRLNTSSRVFVPFLGVESSPTKRRNEQ